MDGKKSFIAYCDWLETFEALPDETAGKLIKHLLQYVSDLDPKSNDAMVNLAFIPLRQSLKRDLKKYESYLEKQRANGAKGGRPPKPKETQITQRLKNKPKKADSVNDSDSVNVTVNDTNKSLSIRIDDFSDKILKETILDFVETTKFIDYWTEHGEKDKKARWEKEKVFDIKKRMARWERNNKSNQQYGQSDTEAHQRVHDTLENAKLSLGNDQLP